MDILWMGGMETNFLRHILSSNSVNLVNEYCGSQIINIYN